ncbi:uncharacterized protein L203_105511 [Cryptococcus depauperatus CBS 7841]|uniref:GDP/GTP exchange factor Sec2 N-terminal domain-containing protein n=1 Tax=Cryptococcus depauperatus CBS 7841 TaxID=1295531 RepID=A0A1E3ID54_9TREE|nr:hypothetical protein L203_04191 [Cryptococcus depauperatus CBS 7841]
MYPLHTAPVFYSASSPQSPSSVQQLELPSFPPRLKAIGRQLSQISNDFLSPQVSDGEAEAGNKRARDAGRRVEKEFQAVQVLGMGDEPVLCPFCNKPLPPALFEHNHGEPSSKETLTRDLLADNVVDSLAARAKEGDLANLDATENLITEQDIHRWSVIAGLSPEQVEQDSNVKREKASEPINATLLIPSPSSSFKKLTKSPPTFSGNTQDNFGLFRRATTHSDDEEPEGDGSARGYVPIGAGPLSDNEDGQVVAQRMEKVKIDEEHHDVELRGEKGAKEMEDSRKYNEGDLGKSAKMVQIDDQVKEVLIEVIARVNRMSKSHDNLLVSHSSLLTSLKIARSNLAMAEANTEMLEQQLKRTIPPVPPIASKATLSSTTSPITSSFSRPGSRPSSPKIGSRLSEETKRPSSLYLSSTTTTDGGKLSASAVDSNKYWPFFGNSKKKPSGPVGSLPSPVVYEDRNNSESFTETNSPYSPTLPEAKPIPQKNVASVSTGADNLASKSTSGGSQLKRSLSVTSSPSSRTSATADNPSSTSAELVELRNAYSSAISKLSALTDEMNHVKSVKSDMDKEIEDLSRVLFEEANKMVADERRKRAAMEDSLNEAREESKALRETVKFLGGQTSSIPKPEPIQGEEGKKEETKDEEFVPRDLDKHYEALRKSIHHISPPSTSPTHQDPPPNSSKPASLLTSESENQPNQASPMDISFQSLENDVPINDSTVSSSNDPAIIPSFGIEPNPWASMDNSVKDRKDVELSDSKINIVMSGLQ